MSHLRPTVSALLVLVVLLGAAACGDDDDSSGGGTAVTADDLVGRSFVATDVTGETIVDDTTIQLTFESDGLSAQAGCNTMTGGFEIDGDVLVVEQLGQTMMGCPPELEAQDTWVAALLMGRPTIELGDGTLTLATADVTMTMEE